MVSRRSRDVLRVRRHRTLEVYTIRARRRLGQPTRITRNGGIFPIWSPDGRNIAYAWTRGIVIVRPTEAGPRRSR